MYTRVPEPALDLPPTQLRIEVKDKQNAVAEAKLEFPLSESDRDFQALRLALQIFGGSGGGSGRLWDRIREKEGLSYGVGALVRGGQFGPNADFGFYAISAPQNIDRVKASFDDELARARRDGFTADELTRAKEAVAAASRLGRAQDASLGRTLLVVRRTRQDAEVLRGARRDARRDVARRGQRRVPQVHRAREAGVRRRGRLRRREDESRRVDGERATVPR